MKLAYRWRTLARVTAVLVLLNGCGLVVGLGEPKKLGKSGSPEGGAPPPPAPQAQDVAVGPDHTCAIVEIGPGFNNNRQVRCWGSNVMGELGTDPKALPWTGTPTLVEGFPPKVKAAELALGTGYSCMISLGSFFFCWGAVPSETPSGVHRLEPTPPALPTPTYRPASMEILTAYLHPVATASVGSAGGCIVENRELICWGSQQFASGRDGGVDGGATISVPGFQKVAVGTYSACTVNENDTPNDVQCWGDDTYGQTGGSVGGYTPDMSPVGLSGDVLQVAVGKDFSCALVADGTDHANGTVSCWGHNDRGQLGPNGPTHASTAKPVVVPFAGGALVSALALGDDHACAVLADGDLTVQCWGDNSRGQLGIGPTGPAYSASPLTVYRPSASGGYEPLPHILRIAAGGSTSCVVRVNDAEVSCWGANESGQAGQPRIEKSVYYATPVAW